MELVNAFKKGDWLTRSSAIVMGLGNILRKQFIKGILFLFTEAAFLFFMAAYGWQCLLALPGLGEKEQGEVWNETLGVYEYVQGDNSLLILLYGIAVLFICAAFICVWAGAVKSAYQAQVCIEKNKPVTTFAEDIKSLFDKNLHKLLLTLPVGGILIFTILPLIFMIAMAFTNYSKVNSHLVLFDWVGLENFQRFLSSQDFMNYLLNTLKLSIFGLLWSFPIPIILALLLNRIRKAGIKKKIQLLIYAPNFISVIVLCGMVRMFLSPVGPLNRLMGTNTNWMTMPSAFRTIYIASGIWQGAGWASIMYTAALSNASKELEEAAIVDGANLLQQIWYVELPAIKDIIVIQFILQAGNIMSIGFEKAYALQTDMNLPASEILSTYVYRIGLLNGDYGYSTAV